MQRACRPDVLVGGDQTARPWGVRSRDDLVPAYMAAVPRR
jgi:hypothetical protein